MLGKSWDFKQKNGVFEQKKKWNLKTQNKACEGWDCCIGDCQWVLGVWSIFGCEVDEDG